MNSEKLSPRLDHVAQLIKQYGSQPIRLADIGSDHAYLPCHLALNGAVSFAIAGEVVEGPYQSAVKEVQQQSLTRTIEVRKGNGLEVVDLADEINVIAICGMGGILIRNILEAGLEVIEENTIFVLQPNMAESQLRDWLSRHHFIIRNERIVEDNDRMYEIIVAEFVSKQQQILSRRQRMFGPFNLREKSDAFVKKWQYELQSQRKIYASMKQGLGETPNQKVSEMENHIQMIKEELERVEK